MRLSQVTTNYRASGLIKRDARHVHNGPEVPRRVRAKKDRKRWCGGHVGREHKPKCMAKRFDRPSFNWYVLACTECGKELASYFPMFRSARRQKPDWVVEQP